jgi:hypothetical protein
VKKIKLSEPQRKLLEETWGVTHGRTKNDSGDSI